MKTVFMGDATEADEGEDWFTSQAFDGSLAESENRAGGWPTGRRCR